MKPCMKLWVRVSMITDVPKQNQYFSALPELSGGVSPVIMRPSQKGAAVTYILAYLNPEILIQVSVWVLEAVLALVSTSTSALAQLNVSPLFLEFDLFWFQKWCHWYPHWYWYIKISIILVFHIGIDINISIGLIIWVRVRLFLSVAY